MRTIVTVFGSVPRILLYLVFFWAILPYKFGVYLADDDLKAIKDTDSILEDIGGRFLVILFVLSIIVGFLFLFINTLLSIVVFSVAVAIFISFTGYVDRIREEL